MYVKSAIPFADEEAWADADEAERAAYGPVVDAQMAMLTTKPTTVAGAAAVLAYMASFWIEGNESSAKGLPVYEGYGQDEMLTAGEGIPPHACGRTPATDSCVNHEGALSRARLSHPSSRALESGMLLRILYLRFRLWVLRKQTDVRNAIGGCLLRCSARLGVIGAWLMRGEPRSCCVLLLL